MKIPLSLKLLGQTITVEYDPSLFHGEDAHGMAKYRLNKIILQPPTDQTPIPKDALEHNFLHELVHHVFFAAGEDLFNPPLHNREWLVDRVAGLLHQVLTTARYEKD